MVDITKQKFGRLIALKPTDERGSDGCVCWLCRCSCGNMSEEKYFGEYAYKGDK